MSAKTSRAVFKFLLVVVVLAGATVTVAYFARPIAKVQPVRRGPAANIVSGSVVVEAERDSPIASEVEGKLGAVDLVPGQVVKENEVIAQIDPTDIDLEIARVENDYNAAKSTQTIALAVAERNWESKKEEMADARREYEVEKKMSDVAFKQRQRAYAVARQNRAQAEADHTARVATLANSLSVAQRKKAKMTIRAPFDGTITKVLVHKNDLIGAKEPIANIIAQTRRVVAKISEEKFATIAVGHKAKVTFLGYPNQKFDATVTQKLPTAEPDTQRYLAYLKVDIAPEKLVPSLTGEIAITVDEHRDVLIVPRRAIADGVFVFVVEDGRTRKQTLDLGFVDLNFAEVKTGLKEGDLVIVEELDRFEDGQRVRSEAAK